jgi:hypothetical protein
VTRLSLSVCLSRNPLTEPILSGAIPASTISALTRVDPVPYGLAAQGTVLDALAAYLIEQGLVISPVNMTELFAPSTRDL